MKARLLDIADRLSGALRLLQERIRDAVASEVGLVAGQTMQNFLHALIRGIGPRLDYAQPLRQEYRDDDFYEPDREPERERPALPPAVLLAPAVGLGARLVDLWLTRRSSTWATLGAGLLTGIMAWCGSPALIAGAVATVAECLVLSRWSVASQTL